MTAPLYLSLSTGGPNRAYAPKIYGPDGTVVVGWDTIPGVAAEAPGGAALALDSSVAALTAKVTSDPSTGTNQTSMLTALGAIKTAIQAQIDLTDLFVMDSSTGNATSGNYYVRETSINEGTGAKTTTILNIDGSVPSPAPTLANLTPVKQAAQITSVATFYDVKTAGGTGANAYAVGDVLARVVLTNTATGAVTASWQNMGPVSTAGTISAPTLANLVEQANDTLSTLQSILAALGSPLQAGGSVNTQVFMPVRKADGTAATTRLTVGTAKTTTPVALPALVATTYRARVPATAANPVTFILTTDNTKAPVIPVAYDATGANGTPGDKTIDPGGVEIIGLSAAQQTALAAGTLYLTAISTGASEIAITPGMGA